LIEFDQSSVERWQEVKISSSTLDQGIERPSRDHEVQKITVPREAGLAELSVLHNPIGGAEWL
jgi:hypothetical protein